MPSPPVSSNPRGVKLVESVWIGFSLTMMIIAARMYTRARIVYKVNWDDYLMLTAFVRSIFCDTNHSIILIECAAGESCFTDLDYLSCYVRIRPAHLRFDESRPSSCDRGNEMGPARPSIWYFSLSICENGFCRYAPFHHQSNTKDTCVDSSHILFLPSCSQHYHSAVHSAAMQTYIWSLGSHKWCQMSTNFGRTEHGLFPIKSVSKSDISISSH